MTVKIKIFISLISVIILGGVGFVAINSIKKPVVNESQIKTKEVEVSSVSELTKTTEPLPVIGSVKSVSEADIQAEAQGEITAVYKKIGDFVYAGTVIAEISNGRERASLLQAQAGIDSATASVDISSLGKDRDAKLLEEARVSALNTLRSAYDTADDAIKTKIDPMFSNPKTGNPIFNISATDSQLPITIGAERVQVENILSLEKERKINLSETSNIPSEIETAKTEIKFMKNFLDKIISSLNQAIPTISIPQSSIDAWKTSASLARTNLDVSLSALSGASDLINTKTAQASISEKQGGTSTGTVANATLKQAEANLALARANYEKTIIRSPISGTINSLDVETGNFVSMFESVAVVSNNKALEVETFITDKDRAYISVGAKATIEGKYPATVTRVAPAIDPKTKKLQVKLGLSGTTDGLVNGQSVQIEIERAQSSGKVGDKIKIPITALKISADKTLVFTVGPDSKLIGKEVKIGPLIGEKIYISEGLTPDMKIVRDARGLKEGETVSVKTK